MYFAPPAPVGKRWFATQIVGSYHKCTIGLWIWHINYPEQAATARFTYRNPRPFATRTVLTRVGKNLLDLRYAHVVVKDVRRASFGIDVETEVHALGLQWS